MRYLSLITPRVKTRGGLTQHVLKFPFSIFSVVKLSLFSRSKSHPSPLSRGLDARNAKQGEIARLITRFEIQGAQRLAHNLNIAPTAALVVSTTKYLGEMDRPIDKPEVSRGKQHRAHVLFSASNYLPSLSAARRSNHAPPPLATNHGLVITLRNQ